MRAAARLAPLIGFASRRQRGHRLRIEESLALDPRRRLHLVVWDGRQVLLLTGGAADLVLDRLPVRIPKEPEATP